MLRSSPGLIEFRLIEDALVGRAPLALDSRRKQELHRRIVRELGRQEPGFIEAAAERLSSRWVAVPAGAGAAAALIAAMTHAMQGQQTADLRTAGPEAAASEPAMEEIAPGRTFVSDAARWLSYGSSARFGLESGSRVYAKVASSDRVELELIAGELDVVTDGASVRVTHSGVAAEMGPGTIARFNRVDALLVVQAFEGKVTVAAPNGVSVLTSGSGPLFIDVSGGTPSAAGPAGMGAVAPPLAEEKLASPELPGVDPPAVESEPGGAQGNPGGTGNAEQLGGQGATPELPSTAHGPPDSVGGGNGNGEANPGQHGGGPPAEPGNAAGNGPPPAPPGLSGEKPSNGPPEDPPGGGEPPAEPPAGPPQEPPGGGPPQDPPGKPADPGSEGKGNPHPKD